MPSDSSEEMFGADELERRAQVAAGYFTPACEEWRATHGSATSVLLEFEISSSAEARRDALPERATHARLHFQVPRAEGRHHSHAPQGPQR